MVDGPLARPSRVGRRGHGHLPCFDRCGGKRQKPEVYSANGVRYFQLLGGGSESQFLRLGSSGCPSLPKKRPIAIVVAPACGDMARSSLYVVMMVRPLLEGYTDCRTWPRPPIVSCITSPARPEACARRASSRRVEMTGSHKQEIAPRRPGMKCRR